MIRRAFGAVAAVAMMLVGTPVVAVVASLPAGAQQGAPVLGGGASFPAPMYDQWKADVANRPYNLNVNYQAAGSTFGRAKFQSGELDFGGSDIPYQASDGNTSRRPFAYVPMTAGGLGIMFNVIGNDGQRINDLKLASNDVCRLFTEDTIFWDDPAIAAVNPGVPLPHNRVRPVVRSDGSGTSYVLSEYCIATSPQVWGAFISLITTNFTDQASPELRTGKPTSTWPTGWGAVSTGFASDGVANVVANDVSGKDAVTYNEAEFARQRGFPNASVRNAAGVFQLPKPAAVTAALAFATGRADGTFQLNYSAPDPAAYFPSSYSYMIVPTSNFSTAKGFTLASFLNYCVTAGQRKAQDLSFARLSTVLVNLALDQIQRIPGAPPRPTDLAGASNTGAPTLGAAAALSPSVGGTGTGGTKAGQPGAAAGQPGAKAAAAAGASPSGGAAGAAARGAPGSPTTPAGGAAGAGGAATDPATPGAGGGYQLDVSNLPQAAVVANLGTGPVGDAISNKDTLWYFVLGFCLLGLGLGIGSSSAGAARRRQEVAS